MCFFSFCKDFHRLIKSDTILEDRPTMCNHACARAQNNNNRKETRNTRANYPRIRNVAVTGSYALIFCIDQNKKSKNLSGARC